MRLIDADALKEQLREELPEATTEQQSDCQFAEIVMFDAWVDSWPTIDAVPVVRCKECRWKEDEQPGMAYCSAVVGGWVDEDWFCKGGERSEE